jgi:hypothetical protein
VSTTCSAALQPTGQPGDSCTATVRLSPPSGTTNGTKSATLHGAAGSLGADATLSGSAVDPSTLAIGPAGPFGYPALLSDGAHSSTQTFTVSNSGGVASGTLTVTLSDSTNYILLNNNCDGNSVAAGGGNCTVDVKFLPQTDSSGTESTTLQVAESGAGLVTKSLSGIAQAPAKLAWSSTSYDWGGVKVTRDDATLDQTFTLTNSGDVSTSAITMSTSGSSGEFFQAASTCTPSGSFTLGAGASCTVTLRYKPTVGGAHSMTLTATAATGAASGVGVSLSGKGQWQLSITTTGATGTGSVASSPRSR